MGHEIRLGLLLVLGLLVLAFWHGASKSCAKNRRAGIPAIAWNFAMTAPTPRTIPPLPWTATASPKTRRARSSGCCRRFPGEPNLVAILSSNDGTVRQEWRWVNRAWNRTAK
jgi:hypothetical protein